MLPKMLALEQETPKITFLRFLGLGIKLFSETKNESAENIFYNDESLTGRDKKALKKSLLEVLLKTP